MQTPTVEQNYIIYSTYNIIIANRSIYTMHSTNNIIMHDHTIKFLYIIIL